MSSIKQILYSHKTTNIYLLILAILFGAATFIEKFYSTQTAKTIIYNNPLVYLLLLFGLIHFAAIAVKGNYIRSKRMGMFLFHASFLFILIGAFITNIFGFEGYMHIREGLQSNEIIITAENNRIKTTPFEVFLKEFKLQRYPGSKRASSYESILRINHNGKENTETLSMNKVIHIDGYRIYQSSFDNDEKGTVLLVNYDPIGMIISYLGYIILFIGIIWIFISSDSLLGRLRKKLAEMPKTCLLFCFFLISSSAFALELDKKYLIPQDHAELFGKLSIQSNTGRIEPFNTYSSKVFRKITGETKNAAVISDSFILSMILYPEYWSQQPVILVNNDELNILLNNNDQYIAFNDLFDHQGNYILDRYVNEISHKSNLERNNLDKAILKLDEKANIFFGLQTGNFTPLFPQPDNKDNTWFSPGDDLSGFTGKDSLFVSKIFMWYLEAADRGIQDNDWSEANKIVGMISTFQQAKSPHLVLDPQKVEMELLYNKFDIFNRAAIAYLALSTLLLLSVFFSIVYDKSFIKPVIRILVTLLVIVFTLHAIGIGTRWYISGQAPWSNSYESLVYAAWCVVLAGIILSRKSLLIFALATFFTGFILLVCRISSMDPEITPLVPVLRSPWLMFHVAVIMASYGFFGISFFISLFSELANLASGNKQLTVRLKELRIMNEMSLIIGLCLLTAGTFLGAIWANESWGRYWGWDPKEVWALVTMLVYAFVVHSRFIPKLYSNWAFNSQVLIAFASLLMTYFGVNYYLSGLHSYGSTESSNIIYMIYAGYLFIFILIGVSYKRQISK